MGDDLKPTVSAESVLPVWLRCKCEQWGRCLTDCPTAHLSWDLDAFLRQNARRGMR